MKKIKAFLIRYKIIIIPGIPLLFFVTMILLIFNPGKNRYSNTQPPGSNSRVSPTNLQTNNDISTHPREGGESEIESRPGIIKKETFNNGTTKYSFTSPNAERPNIIIAKSDRDVLFQRSVTLLNAPVKITDYTKSYGNPKWIFKGSVFYGPAAQTYIYPELGFAFIANPQTGEVFEQHLFQPTKVEDYVNKYGDDIPAQP